MSRSQVPASILPPALAEQTSSWDQGGGRAGAQAHGAATARHGAREGERRSMWCPLEDGASRQRRLAASPVSPTAAPTPASLSPGVRRPVSEEYARANSFPKRTSVTAFSSSASSW